MKTQLKLLMGSLILAGSVAASRPAAAQLVEVAVVSNAHARYVHRWHRHPVYFGPRRIRVVRHRHYRPGVYVAAHVSAGPVDVVIHRDGYEYVEHTHVISERRYRRHVRRQHRRERRRHHRRKHHRHR